MAARVRPRPVTDLKWWTGWNAGDVKKALALLDVTEVDLGGNTGIVLSDDLEPAPEPEPWAALLPALDATPMGWQERGWFLGGHGLTLFDRNGNIGPSIWWDGRVVGGWAQRRTARSPSASWRTSAPTPRPRSTGRRRGWPPGTATCVPSPLPHPLERELTS